MRLMGGMVLLATLAAATYGPGVQPGTWETVITTESVEVPGPLAEMMRKTKGQATRSTVCLTPEQAAKGPQGALAGNKACRISRQSAANGRFSAEMICEQSGRRSVSTTDGVYTPTTFAGKTRILVDGGAGMAMHAAITSRRLGACTK